MSPLDRESLARSLRVKRFSDSTDLESDILRALRAPALRILLPTTGSIPSRLGSQAAGGKLRGAAAAKSAEKREDGDASPASEEPKPRLQNPEWVWIEDPKRPGCEERRLGESALLDVLFCKVDTADLMPGDTVTFKIALKSGSHEPETWVDTVTGRVGAGRNDEAAVGRFVLPPEVAGRKVIPKKDIFIFEAKVFSHQLSLKGPELKVVPKQPIFVMSY